MKGDTGSIVLTAGQKLKVLTGPANYFYLYESSGLVKVQLLRESRDAGSHNVTRLTMLPSKDFDEFEVENISSATVTLRIFYGPGAYVPPQDRSLVTIDDSTPPVVDLAAGATLNLTGSSVTVNQNISNAMTALADITVSSTAVEIATADVGARFELMVSIPESEPNGIRIGGADVTATKGGYIPPGTIVFVPFEGALYAIRAGAADVSVTRTALRRV